MPSRRAVLRAGAYGLAATGVPAGAWALAGCGAVPPEPSGHDPSGQGASTARPGGRGSTAPAGSASPASDPPGWIRLPAAGGLVDLVVDPATPGAAAVGTALRSCCDVAWGWVARTWPGVAHPDRVRVLAAADVAGFADRAGLGGAGTGARQVAAHTTGDGQVLLNPLARRDLTAQGVQVVLAHEFTHVLLRQYAGRPGPRWVVEGSAQWTATRATERRPADLAPSVHAAVLAGRPPAGPPDDAAFVPGPGLAGAYEQAQVWFAFLESRYGAARVRDLVRRHATAADPVAAAFGVPARRLRADYAVFLRDRLA